MEKLLEKLLKEGKTLGSIESMTGGMFAANFTSVPGASKVFKGSVVTYTSEVKNKVVGVNLSTIEKYSVVSSEVAYEMAEKGRVLLGVDYCVSITGNAGPTVEPGGKNVGVCYIGISSKNKTVVKEYQFSGKRNDIRNKAILAMRDFLYLEII